MDRARDQGMTDSGRQAVYGYMSYMTVYHVRLFLINVEKIMMTVWTYSVW